MSDALGGTVDDAVQTEESAATKPVDARPI